MRCISRSDFFPNEFQIPLRYMLLLRNVWIRGCGFPLPLRCTDGSYMWPQTHLPVH